MQRKGWAVLVLLVLLLLGCAGQFIASYDPNFHRDATELQSKADTFFAQLERVAGTPTGVWAHHQSFYQSAQADVERLRARAAQHERNATTLRSLDLLAAALHEVEDVHRGGLVAAEVTILREQVATQLRLLVDLESAKARLREEAR